MEGNGWNEFRKTMPSQSNIEAMWKTWDQSGMIAGFSTYENLYPFPWYLFFMPTYYKIEHWLKTGEWPIRILYFPKGRGRDKDLYKKVLREYGLLQ